MFKGRCEESKAGVHLSSQMISTGYWGMAVGGVKSCLSVDVWQILVVPIEVAASVEPVLGAGVCVGAQLEPPG